MKTRAKARVSAVVLPTEHTLPVDHLSTSLASLPVALPPHRYLATGGSTFKLFFNIFSVCRHLTFSTYLYVFTCEITFPSLFPPPCSFLCSQDSDTTPRQMQLPTTQTFHHWCEPHKLGSTERERQAEGLKSARSAARDDQRRPTSLPL